MHYVRMGSGKPLLLVHGLGGTWRWWETVIPGLAEQRDLIGIDLPGFGETPPLPGEVSIASLAGARTYPARRAAGFSARHGRDRRGRQDRVCMPSQSKRVMELFPDARLHWFNHCGHFPYWEQPAAAVDLILGATA